MTATTIITGAQAAARLRKLATEPPPTRPTIDLQVWTDPLARKDLRASRLEREAADLVETSHQPGLSAATIAGLQRQAKTRLQQAASLRAELAFALDQ